MAYLGSWRGLITVGSRVNEQETCRYLYMNVISLKIYIAIGRCKGGVELTYRRLAQLAVYGNKTTNGILL